ncbi:glycosyltransferase 87 family protein [Salsipaludibacter albus]|uniref:glycosyltransferase 87 family protein n=1 Tax=Salsipaludibacter albus TaxID=2849650 RepID=UPI001EE4C9BD|nr:glycosyltransferase 87 family protein [Salsipaludibacter albus]MBY5164513.1 DUF2029 domain-containing protein [Salsipaludibacter albus]
MSAVEHDADGRAISASSSDGFDVPALLAALASAAAVFVSVWWKSTHMLLPEAYTMAGYSDVAALFGARSFGQGIPWVDQPLEYPPGIGLVAWGIGVPSQSATQFLVATGVLLAACAAVATWLLAREVGWRRPTALMAGPIVMMAAAVNWDLLTVALATGGLVAHRRGRDLAAGILLGLGVATKLWPALLLLLVVPAAWRLRGLPNATRTALGAAGAWLLLNVPVMLASWEGWRLFLDLNQERVADWDSLWYLVVTPLGWDPSVPVLNAWVAVLTLVTVVVLLVMTVRSFPAVRWHEAGLALVAAFLLVGKVWSPQFTLWLLPLLALAWPGWRIVAALTVFDVGVHVTRFRHLAGYVGDGLEGAWPVWPFTTAVLLRDAMVLLAVWAWWRSRSGTGAATTSSGGSAPDPGSHHAVQ